MSLLSNALESLSAMFGQLRAALTPPPTTRVPLTNAEIKALRAEIIADNSTETGSTVRRDQLVRVCNAALDGRKRNRRYARAIRNTLAVDAS